MRLIIAIDRDLKLHGLDCERLRPHRVASGRSRDRTTSRRIARIHPSWDIACTREGSFDRDDGHVHDLRPRRDRIDALRFRAGARNVVNGAHKNSSSISLFMYI